MRIGLQLSYAEGFEQAVAELADCEQAGLDLVVVPEAYSFDAVSQLGYLAARTSRVALASGVMQLFSRTPTLTAMTAAGLDFVSGGRFTLGLGTSGPQVVEGFHGVPFDAPVGRTREVVEICRRVWRREELTYAGRHYRIPLPEGEGTGLGKPLKLINTPVRERIPILLGAVGPRNVELAAEIADGWQPLFFHPERADRAWGESLARGLAKRAPELGPLDVMVTAPLAFTDTPQAVWARHRQMLALYLGGMGAKEKNFSNDLACRYGYADEAARVQELFLSGRRREAIAAVPEDLVRATCLAGPPGAIRDRLDALAAAGATTLLVSPVADTRADRVRAIEQLREMN
ncbi:MAG: LLM class F420-dependent oxidoreductase [Hamadaea sp.]|nr:LLM class F420-dependent oxidoreductase [Hamadaea sp.]